MVQRYTDWEKRKSQIRKDLPWWQRNWGIVRNCILAGVFIWTFGAIYKLQWFPPDEVIRRAVDPRFGDDKIRAMKRIEQREEVLAKKNDEP